MSIRFETLFNTKKCPWLIYTHGTRNRPKQSLFNLIEGRCYNTSLPTMSDMSTYACSYEWILMIDIHSYDCFLFNPISMEKVELPDWVSGYQMRNCNLSHPPDDPSCIVLAFSSEPQPCIRFCKPGDTEWTDQVLDCEDKLMDCLVPIGGKFYGLYEYKTKLMVLEYDGFKINMKSNDKEEGIMVPCHIMSGMLYSQRHLVESCGELFIVIITYFGLTYDKIRYIQVDKFDMNKLTWERVENLSDRAFFISTRGFGKSCLASEYGIKKNCIYCALGGEKNLFIFDMEDLNITTIVPCPERFKNWMNTHWVFPL